MKWVQVSKDDERSHSGEYILALCDGHKVVDAVVASSRKEVKTLIRKCWGNMEMVVENQYPEHVPFN